jgi:uncharacterized protein (TIGR01777 family)
VHVFVTGATGLIGRALVHALLRRGDVVSALSRSAEAPRLLPLGVRHLCGDPAEAGAWEAELANADACVHLAGAPLAEGRWTAESKRLIRDSRVDSTRRIAEVLRRGGPEVLISGSAVGIYGDRGDEELTEAAALGVGFLAQVASAWEEAAQPAAERARVVALRTGIVLAREGGALPKLAMPFKFMAGGALGDGAFWQPWIHLADEVGLILFALDSASLEGPLNAVAPAPVRNRDLARAIGAVLHRPSLLHAPAFAIRAALGEVAGEIMASQRAVPQKALKLGYRFRFAELEPALRDLLRR